MKSLHACKHDFQPTVLSTVALMLKCCVCLSVVCDVMYCG